MTASISSTTAGVRALPEGWEVCSSAVEREFIWTTIQNFLTELLGKQGVAASPGERRKVSSGAVQRDFCSIYIP